MNHDFDGFVSALWENGEPQPGTVTELDIVHDDDCPRLYGGIYNCAPDVRQRSQPLHVGKRERIEVLRHKYLGIKDMEG